MGDAKNMTMTVQQVYDILKEMKSVYQYDDNDSKLWFFNPKRNSCDEITLVTHDVETGVEVTLCKSISEDRSEC